MKSIKNISLFAGTLTLGILLLISCKKNKEETTPEVDKSAILSNIGTNVIVPNYQAFQVAVTKLDSTVLDFNSSPDATKLQNLQTKFVIAYKAWQKCSMIEFGPSADTEYLRINLNTFPTDSVQIKANVTAGSWSLGSGQNVDAKGFPALDYILFGSGVNNAAILALFTSDAEAANRKLYLAALSLEIKTKVTNVTNAWLPSGGNYLETFINSTGTDIGSSFGFLVNQISFEMDLIKNAKMGIPMGKQSMGTLYPDKTEAYYSGISVELMKIELETLEDLYLGRNAMGVDGQGLDDYLNEINAQYNGGSLSTAIKTQFETTLTAFDAVPDPFSSTLQTNSTVTEAAYVEVQKLLVLLKTDMASSMGVLITYVDNDGD